MLEQEQGLSEESWREEQSHPHGGRNGYSPAKPSTEPKSSRREKWTRRRGKKGRW